MACFISRRNSHWLSIYLIIPTYVISNYKLQITSVQFQVTHTWLRVLGSNLTFPLHSVTTAFIRDALAVATATEASGEGGGKLELVREGSRLMSRPHGANGADGADGTNGADGANAYGADGANGGANGGKTLSKGMRQLVDKLSQQYDEYS